MALDQDSCYVLEGMGHTILLTVSSRSVGLNVDQSGDHRDAIPIMESMRFMHPMPFVRLSWCRAWYALSLKHVGLKNTSLQFGWPLLLNSIIRLVPGPHVSQSSGGRSMYVRNRWLFLHVSCNSCPTSLDQQSVARPFGGTLLAFTVINCCNGAWRFGRHVARWCSDARR